MAYDAITAEEIAQDQPVTEPLLTKVKGNFEYLYSMITSPVGVPNPSFENDTDVDGTPDNWTLNLYTGGTFDLDDTSPNHGAKCAKFTHPGGAGNGGGYLTSSYLECSPTIYYWLSFLLWASAAGMKNIVSVKFYDEDQSYLSETVLLSSTSNPATATFYTYVFIPPAGARYMKIVLTGGYNDTDVAGSAYFDAVEIGNDLARRPPVTAGSLVLVASAPTERGGTDSWSQIKEVTINRPGAYRVSWSSTNANNTYATYTQIYKNGVAVGVSEVNQTNGSTLIHSQDLSGWQKGDLLQLCIYVQTGGTGSASNLNVYCNDPLFYVSSITD
jgi:hypothetical protein